MCARAPAIAIEFTCARIHRRSLVFFLPWRTNKCEFESTQAGVGCTAPGAEAPLMFSHARTPAHVQTYRILLHSNHIPPIIIICSGSERRAPSSTQSHPQTGTGACVSRRRTVLCVCARVCTQDAHKYHGYACVRSVSGQNQGKSAKTGEHNCFVLRACENKMYAVDGRGADALHDCGAAAPRMRLLRHTAAANIESRTSMRSAGHTPCVRASLRRRRRHSRAQHLTQQFLCEHCRTHRTHAVDDMCNV